MQAPFQAEMLCLADPVPGDLVDHLAAEQGGVKAVKLDPTLRRLLGVGNSTGLGMALPSASSVLIHHWFAAREEALARVRSNPI